MTMRPIIDGRNQSPPKRPRLAPLEVGLALAVTVAAAVQLLSNIAGRDEKNGTSNASLIRPAN